MDSIRYWIETEGSGHYFFIAFPICLLILFIFLKGRRIRFLIPSLIISLVIINPWFYRAWDGLGLYAYWRILWVVPVIPIVAIIVPCISEVVKSFFGKGIVTVAGIGVIALGGTFLYNGAGGNFAEAPNAAKLPQDVVDVANHLLELEDRPRVIAQHPIGVYLRQYSGKIDQLYGRDVSDFILDPGLNIKNVHWTVSSLSGKLSDIAQYMVNNDWDYIVLNDLERKEEIAKGELTLADRTGDYGIYVSNQIPSEIRRKNDLGQIIEVTTVDEMGTPVNGSHGYSTIEYEYDNQGRQIKELYKDTVGSLIEDDKGIAGYIRGYDNKSQIIREQTLGVDALPKVVYQNYAEIRKSYEDGRIIREEYYNIDGNPAIQPGGYYAIEQEWNANTLLKRTYLDASGKPIDRFDGYSRIELQGDNVRFYNTNGEEVPIEGLNLFRTVRTYGDGWTTWFMPVPDKVNYCISLGNINLGKKRAGDTYSCQIEIEFSDVVTNEEGFLFCSQGSTDDRWDVGNIWSHFVWLEQPPENNIYSFSTTVVIDEKMANARNFEIGFRCDNWAGGSFRVRNVKIEKNNVPSEWTPGI